MRLVLCSVMPIVKFVFSIAIKKKEAVSFAFLRHLCTVCHGLFAFGSFYAMLGCAILAISRHLPYNILYLLHKYTGISSKV